MTTKEYNRAVDLFADKLYRFILKNTRDRELSNDVVQQAYLRLWEQVSQIPFEKSKAWLFSTSYRYMIDLLRREKKNADWKEAEHLNVAFSKHYDGLEAVLDEALLKIPELQRSLVMLRDYEGYSYSEIGEIMQLSESQVKVYIFRARKSLKEYLVSVETIL